MRRGGSLFGGVFVGLCALGCAKTPYQLKQEAQARQVAQLRPAQLEHDSSSWRALRSMRLRLYVRSGGDLASQRSAFEERLERANQVFESAMRLRVVLEDVRELPAQQPIAIDTENALRELERLDPGQDVDFVVAIIAASPVVTLSFHELGRANVLGKHMVVRTMDDVAELRALEGFDTLDPNERSQLYQQRKRHKETAVLLHELGHLLGAVHTRDNLELMHPAHDNAMRGFAPANVELMDLVVQKRLRDPNQLGD
ncbi:MAG TPA: M12 family metallo-peptidase, partial [Polyangiaceae bacterium]|nr:M12 family metallo-peptidase [Polyangiaceae bacterium]